MEISHGSFSQKYCGTSIPGPFSSSGTTMTVSFSSSYLSVNGQGFLAVVCCSVNVTTNTTGGTEIVPSLKLSQYWQYCCYVISINNNCTICNHNSTINNYNCNITNHQPYYNQLYLWLGAETDKDCRGRRDRSQ